MVVGRRLSKLKASGTRQITDHASVYKADCGHTHVLRILISDWLEAFPGGAEK